jgi:hypothetical protein
MHASCSNEALFRDQAAHGLRRMFTTSQSKDLPQRRYLRTRRFGCQAIGRREGLAAPIRCLMSLEASVAPAGLMFSCKGGAVQGTGDWRSSSILALRIVNR